MRKRAFIYLGLCAALLTGCNDADYVVPVDDTQLGNVIHVGGISAEGLVASATVTRAGEEETVQRIDAEKVSWLLVPLFEGLDITYGKSDRTNKHVAVLKLKKASENPDVIKYSEGTEAGGGHLAEYSFKYRDDSSGDTTQIEAKWYDNGPHFFEGVYVPKKIQYTSGTTENVWGSLGTAPNLKTDQHDDNTTEGSLGNYTLLSHYLGMPSNFTLNATVGRVKLPFRHRLSRVIAYILIDPKMSGVKIDGYNYKVEDNVVTPEDETTTKIKFCNVKVLEGVLDEAAKQHHTYTPKWGEARKATPHFVGERGSWDDKQNTSRNDEHFIAFYDVDKKTYVYPTDDNWTTLNGYTYDSDGKCTTTAHKNKYEKTVYGKVPVYDLIVRPTYTSEDRVMYDEEGFYDSNGIIDTGKRNTLYTQTNKIDFEVTLDNQLHYTKRFEFDLDANYQTVVYLHIDREGVDYNSSGSVLWQETRADDDWYGVNNQNGNNLSIAGSSWQRAYTNGAVGGAPSPFTDEVTDGHKYTSGDRELGDKDGQYAQYVDDEKWIEMFLQAREGGTHHGDYFILKKDISITIPENFVFTGHLDGQDHTITINRPFTGLNGNYTTSQEPNGAETWEANVHKEIRDGNTYWVPYKDDVAGNGWRAEIINTNFAVSTGSSVFAPSDVYQDSSEDWGTNITGYLHNCWVNSSYNSSTKKWVEGKRLKDYIPSIPKY